MSELGQAHLSRRVLSLGHAGSYIEQDGVALLCDPWFTDGGAMLHRLHQFPPNDIFDFAEFERVRFIYLSHEHEDHFDPQFLTRFVGRDVTILVARFVSDRIVGKLNRLGLTQVERLKDWHPRQLGPRFFVQIVRDPALYRLDSTIVIDAGGLHLVNFNDSHIPRGDFARLREFGVDVLMGQFSCAHWFPHVNGFSADELRAKAFPIRDRILNGFIELANGIGAKLVLHNSGPFCFLHDDLFAFNFKENGAYWDQMDVLPLLQKALTGQVRVTLPGDALQFDATGQLTAVTARMSFDFSQKEQLLRQYQQQRMPAIARHEAQYLPPDPTTLQQFGHVVGQLLSASDYLRNRVDCVAQFALTGPHGGQFWVDVRDGALRICDQAPSAAKFEFALPSVIAQQVAVGRTTMEDVFPSMYLQIREPGGIYNHALIALLMYGDNPPVLRTVELHMRNEDTFVAHDGDEVLQVQRFCPHAGQDLCDEPVVDGKIVCPRHGWIFDLRANGACVSGGHADLRVQRMGQRTTIEQPPPPHGA